MQTIANEGVVRKSSSHSWWKFPVRWIVENPRVEGFCARGVWLVVPLQYYVLTRFPNGFSHEAYVPAAMMSLVSIVALFALSCVLALVFYRTEAIYERRVRIWAITLIVSWAATLGLLALSYMVALQASLDADLIGYSLCQKMDCQAGHPTFEPPTILSYLIYSSLALMLLLGMAHLARRKSTTVSANRLGVHEPNVFVVIFVITLLMTLLHGVSTLPHYAR